MQTLAVNGYSMPHSDRACEATYHRPSRKQNGSGGRVQRVLYNGGQKEFEKKRRICAVKGIIPGASILRSNLGQRGLRGGERGVQRVCTQEVRGLGVGVQQGLREKIEGGLDDEA